MPSFSRIKLQNLWVALALWETEADLKATEAGGDSQEEATKIAPFLGTSP
jgi:hypothetical protein